MLETKTAIVTGASRGIGHATAQRFRDLGWRVITVSRTPPPDACPWSQGGNTHISLDLSDLQQILKTVEALRPLLGGAKLHALFAQDVDGLVDFSVGHVGLDGFDLNLGQVTMVTSG